MSKPSYPNSIRVPETSWDMDTTFAFSTLEGRTYHLSWLGKACWNYMIQMDEADELGMFGGSPEHPHCKLFFSKLKGIAKNQQETEDDFVTKSNRDKAEDFKDSDIFPFVHPFVDCGGNVFYYNTYERLFYWDNPRPLSTDKADWRKPVVTVMS